MTGLLPLLPVRAAQRHKPVFVVERFASLMILATRIVVGAKARIVESSSTLPVEDGCCPWILVDLVQTASTSWECFDPNQSCQDRLPIHVAVLSISEQHHRNFQSQTSKGYHERDSKLGTSYRDPLLEAVYGGAKCQILGPRYEYHPL